MSENVAEALRAMGFRVDRISGADRYETARRAARTFAPDELSTVYLASGVNFADAVAVAPSVTSDTPLILSTPTELHAEARRFLTDHDIGSVTILGGRAAISDDVEAEIKDLGIETRRFAGADRYETAAMIARQSFSTPGCYPVADIAVASGTVPYGGLVAGAVRGPCQPLLLAPPPTSAVPEALAAFGQDWLLAIGSSTQASVTGIGPSSDVSYDSLATVASGAVVGSGATEAEGGAQAWERVAPSVVEVQCVNENGRVVQSGSGFAVGNGRQIVTNYHIAYRGGGPCKLTRVWVGGTFNEAPQRRYTATIVRSASERDLALLALSPSAGALPAVTIATEPSKAGETITVLGYPGVGGATPDADDWAPLGHRRAGRAELDQDRHVDRARQQRGSGVQRRPGTGGRADPIERVCTSRPRHHRHAGLAGAGVGCGGLACRTARRTGRHRCPRRGELGTGQRRQYQRAVRPAAHQSPTTFHPVTARSRRAGGCRVLQ